MSHGVGVIRFIIDETLPLSKAAQERCWRQFISGGTNHSARGATLSYILNRAEFEGVAYTLTAMPGQGYYVAPYTSH
jgi:hypothetical protein